MAVIARRGAARAAAPLAAAARELPCVAAAPSRPFFRGFAAAAPVPAAAAGGAAAGGWLQLRPPPVPEPRLDEEVALRLAEKLPERRYKAEKLSLLSGRQLAELALRLAADLEGSVSWSTVLERLQDERVYLDECDALLVLHALVRKNAFDRSLMARVVDIIEIRYFSMELAVDDRHPAFELFSHQGSYRSLVDALPIDHKVRLVLLDQLERDTGLAPRRRPAPERDAETEWNTMDPVDMEEKEKQHFFKSRIRVMRTKNLRVRVQKMQPGKRLRGVLAFQLMEAIPFAPPSALAQIAQVTAFPSQRALRGDSQRDFQEALAARLLDFDRAEIQPFVVALATGMAPYSGSRAFQAWRTKLLPCVAALLKRDGLARRLDEQSMLHPRLRGLPHRDMPLRSLDQEPAGLARGGSLALPVDDQELLGARLERCAALLSALASAKQVDVDAQLYDAVARPLKTFLGQWVESQEMSPGDESLSLPVELLADIAAASGAAGIRDPALAALLSRALRAGFGQDASRVAGEPADLAVLASFLAYGSGAGANAATEEAVGLLYSAAAPMLRDTEPHVALMLLDAAVRGGPEALLTSETLREAVDELLVQRLDFDADLLGKLGH